MPKNDFVVQISGTDLFLTGYNQNDPPNSIFGNLSNAVSFATLQAAQDVATSIGGGGVGLPRPH